ncbi:MAG: adenosine deaminase [Ilumatobacteraceae bacterium]
MNESWIAGLPKVELHVHLEGSLQPSTVATLAARHGRDTAEVWPDGLPESFSFLDFPDFARQFLFGLSLLRTSDDLRAAVVSLGESLQANNVRYAEVTTTAYSHLTRGMSAPDYGAALDDGRREVAARHGIALAWVIDIPRDLETPDSTVTTDYLAGPHTPANLVAIGLGGYEVGFPARPYAEAFARARALGLRAVPHAGETEGADSVAAALDSLGADRIGHGVRCLEDAALVRRLADSGVMLEVCPTSNVLLGVTPSIEAHPVRTMIDAGLNICINTDDPGSFGTDLVTELQLVHDHHGIGTDQLRVLQLAALDASFAEATVRAELAAGIREY